MMRHFALALFFIVCSPALGDTARSAPLSHDELARWVAAIPTIEKPELTNQHVTEARAVLKGYESRTGQRLARSMFDQQLGWQSTDLEWRAELSAFAIMSWDKQRVIKTGRYEQLSAAMLRFDMAKEVSYGNGLLLASAEHRSSFKFNTYDIPVIRHLFVGLEQQQRLRLASFNELVRRVSDLLD